MRNICVKKITNSSVAQSEWFHKVAVVDFYHNVQLNMLFTVTDQSRLKGKTLSVTDATDFLDIFINVTDVTDFF